MGGRGFNLVYRAIISIWEDNVTFQPVDSQANGIDEYYGELSINDTCSLMADMNVIEYITVPGLRLELNTGRCHNLSAKNFLRNNDSNVTASCVHINFIKDDIFQLQVSP